MSAALAKPAAVPIGVIKQFGPYGPQYEVLGLADARDGKARVEIIVLHSGEKLSYSFAQMMDDPEAV